MEEIKSEVRNYVNIKLKQSVTGKIGYEIAVQCGDLDEEFVDKLVVQAVRNAIKAQSLVQNPSQLASK